MELRGPTLTLRIPQEEDAAALFALASDPQVTEWFSWGPYASIEHPLPYLRRLPGQRERGEQLDLLIVHHEQGPAGIIGLSEFSARDRRAMVGTWLGRHFWGTGVNAEAKDLIMGLGFREIGLQRIGAYANPANQRSVQALVNVGFVREGTLRSYHRHGDRLLDVHIFSVLRDEWMSSHHARTPAQLSGEVPPAFRLGD